MINSIRRNQPRLLRLKLERRRQEILLCLPLAQRAKQLQLEMKFTRNRKEKAFTIKGECIKQEYNSASGRGSKFDSISYFISMNDWPPLDIYFPPISFFFLSGLYQKLSQAGNFSPKAARAGNGARHKN